MEVAVNLEKVVDSIEVAVKDISSWTRCAKHNSITLFRKRTLRVLYDDPAVTQHNDAI